MPPELPLMFTSVPGTGAILVAPATTRSHLSTTYVRRDDYLRRRKRQIAVMAWPILGHERTHGVHQLRPAARTTPGRKR